MPQPVSAESLLAALDPEQREVATALSGPGRGHRGRRHRQDPGDHPPDRLRRGDRRLRPHLGAGGHVHHPGGREMRGRLQQLGAHGVQARTFHSAALRQAQYFWPRRTAASCPACWTTGCRWSPRPRVGCGSGSTPPELRDLVAEIAWAKVSNVTPEDYPRLAGQPPSQCRLVRPGDGRARSSRLRAGEARSRPDRLRGHPAVRRGAAVGPSGGRATPVRRTYRHLVVDEYQDVSPLQQALLELGAATGPICAWSATRPRPSTRSPVRRPTS